MVRPWKPTNRDTTSTGAQQGCGVHEIDSVRFDRSDAGWSFDRWLGFALWTALFSVLVWVGGA